MYYIFNALYHEIYISLTLSLRKSLPGQRRLCSQNTIVSEGFKGGTRGAPIMPRDAVSRTAHVGTVGKNGLTKFCVHLTMFLLSLVFLFDIKFFHLRH